MKPSDFDDLTETTQCRYGKISYFKSDQVIGASLHEYGEWAQKELDILLRLVQKGDIVIDVGAYIGTHTMAFAQRVGETGKVYAFEPNPNSFSVLTHNIKQNKFDNVQVEQVAISEQEGELQLPASRFNISNNPGNITLETEVTERENFDYTDLERVKVKKLDQYNFKKISLIKIDVEGMETLVLKGAHNLLQDQRPIIYAECLSVTNGANMMSFILNRKYMGFLHCDLAYNKNNFKNNTKNIFGFSREANIIFVPHERLYEFYQLVGYQFKMIPLYNLDDLVLGLIFKPQYKNEVLNYTKAEKIIGNDFWLNYPEKYNLNHTFKLQIQSLNAQLAEKDQSIQALNTQLAESRNEVLYYALSTSWRITRPLRKIMNLFRGKKND